MNNLLLFALLAVVVLVNVYFTYRRTEGVDKQGKILLAASQLLYLVVVVVVFGLGWLFKVTGLAGKMQAGGASWPVYIGSIVIVAIVVVVLVYFKSRLEKKIRAEHAL
ncbi:MAG: hypothetical protein IKF54_05855 [Eubacterium sp.]|nr:hypothetical protein [Eubacterium sp.]